MKVLCEDPATNTMFTIISIPILYPEDEDSLCSQMSSLIGTVYLLLLCLINEYLLHCNCCVFIVLL